jgi:lipopolysaccharide export system permease protein
MILLRYLARNMYKGSAMVLFILISLSLFYSMVRELDNIGEGTYGVFQMLQFLLMNVPAIMVDFMPLAVLLGSILSLGSLASGSEIIAMQSSGVSVKKLLISVTLAASMVALFTVILANIVVPYSEPYAKEFRSAHRQSRISMTGRSGVWIKDENNIIHIQQLYPDGNARDIKIYHLDKQDKLTSTTIAAKATAGKQGWLLHKVKQTLLSGPRMQVQQQDEWLYKGQLSDQLLESMATDPRQMSITDLSHYIDFLTENSLSHKAESLFLWRKIYSPLGIIVMAVLAIPFVLGSQRQSNTGQRVLTGILLGLLYVVMNKLLIQIGEQANLVPFINAFLPTFIFMLITAWLIRRKIATR